MSNDDTDRLEVAASDATKALGNLQTLVQGFADKHMSVASLDTERDAATWVKAATTFTAEASMIWVESAMFLTRQTTRFVGEVIKDVQRQLDAKKVDPPPGDPPAPDPSMGGS